MSVDVMKDIIEQEGYHNLSEHEILAKAELSTNYYPGSCKQLAVRMIPKEIFEAGDMKSAYLAAIYLPERSSFRFMIRITHFWSEDKWVRFETPVIKGLAMSQVRLCTVDYFKII